jgi:hypothetical protein
MLRIFFIFITLFFTVSISKADSCSQQGFACNQRGNITVSGVLLTNVCLRVVATEDCVRSEPLNNCTNLEPLKVANSVSPLGNDQCHLISETCIKSNGGECNKYQRKYSCWNTTDLTLDNATLIDREFLNLEETFTDNCNALISDPNCSYDGVIISQDADTRVFNGLDISRSWWEKTKTYNCTNNNYVDTCDDYDGNPVCTLIETPTCLATDDNQNCEYEERLYECDAEAEFTANCEAINVCVGGNCEGIEQELSNDYPNAAVWLNFLQQASDEHNCDADPNSSSVVDGTNISSADCADPNQDLEEPKLFNGTEMTCDTEILKNCCRDPEHDWCKPSEQVLKAKSDAGTTQYIGVRCSSFFLWWCATTSYSFCTYDTKFGRVFQQQVNRQTNSQFRYRTADPCPALTIAQLETLDIGAMNFSEVFSDMMDKTTAPIEALLVERLRNEMGVFTNEAQNNLE